MSERATKLLKSITPYIYDGLLNDGEIAPAVSWFIDEALQEERKQAAMEAWHLLYGICEHDALDCLEPHFGITENDWENWKPREETEAQDAK